MTSRKLAASAAQHTREMGANGYFDHDSLGASPFWKRIQRWYPSSGWSEFGGKPSRIVTVDFGTRR